MLSPRILIKDQFGIEGTVSPRLMHEGGAFISVGEFYKDKHVLITGCTGFVGKSLVEKLLRSCPDVGRIYLPIRTTKKGDADQRYRAFINSKVFDELRVANSGIEDKLVPLQATLEDENLGLTKDVFDNLTSEVSVIFHVAALIKLNPPLREAIRSNVLVSSNMFQFGKQCKQLSAYVYVSSLYTHMDLECVEEKVYPTAWNHKQLIQLMDSDDLRRKRKDILGSSPGTYFATKRVSEYMTQLEGGSSPIAIVRLGKVCPSIKYPVPGWSSGFASYIPWMTMVEKGDFRYSSGKPDVKDEILPVDICAKSLVATAWYIGTHRQKSEFYSEPFVVNLYNSRVNFVHHDLITHVNKYLRNTGSSSMVTLQTSRYRFLLRAIFPSLFRAVRDKIRGGKPISLMFCLFVFWDKGLNHAQYRHNKKTYNNLDKVDNALCSKDKEDFSSGIDQVNWEEYIHVWLRAVTEKREAREKRAQRNS